MTRDYSGHEVEVRVELDFRRPWQTEVDGHVTLVGTLEDDGVRVDTGKYGEYHDHVRAVQVTALTETDGVT
ncbi:MAG: hypothetical protein ABW168_25910 [Sedimenticola sp.]